MAVLALGVLSTLTVGQVLIHTGQTYLEGTCDDRRVASSGNGLVAVLFHLGALGVLAVISVVDVPVTGTAHVIVTKLGIFLLVLGLLTLGSIRARNRQIENMIFQFETTQRQARIDPPTDNRSTR